MSNVRTIHVDWYNQRTPSFKGGPQLAYQGDHLSNMVVFDNAPELPNYYLLVEMKTDDEGPVVVLPEIQLEGPQWVIPNYYTQICQQITYQVCCKTGSGDYEHHSAKFHGTILPVLKHNGEPIDQSPMFDPYIDILDKRVDELIVASGDIQIDSELKSDSGNPVQNRVVKAAIDGLEDDVDAVNGRLDDLNDDISELEDAIDETPKESTFSSNEDLEIVDPENYAIVRFVDGHITTKNFNSKDAVDSITDIDNRLGNIPLGQSVTDDYDLVLADPAENYLAIFSDGHIRTKNFNSQALFHHTYYGEQLPFGKHYFDSVDYMQLDYNPTTYIEGGACFGNIYFQFCENMKTVGVFDLSTKTTLYTWTNPSSGDHCNSATFGNVYYDSADPFPLLYISGQRTHSIYVYRIIVSDATYDFILVQTITFEDAETTGIYYPDYAIDVANNRIIASGYTQHSYSASNGNKRIIKTYNLPTLSDGDITITDSQRLKTFTSRAYSTSQGCFALDGKIYEVFGSYSAKYIIVLDTLSERISSIMDISASVVGEPESLFVYDNGLYVVSQNRVDDTYTFFVTEIIIN